MTVETSTTKGDTAPGSWGAVPFDTHRHALFIGGAWVTTLENCASVAVLDPATGAVVGSAPAASPGDVNRAVRSARSAFTGWSVSEPALRARLLRALASRLGAHSLEMAALISSETGTPLDDALGTEVGRAIDVLEAYAELVDHFEWCEPLDPALVRFEPAGVVAAIATRSHPLPRTVARVAAVIGAGCALVLKPSDDAPLAAYLLAELFADACAEVGADPAILSVVSGSPEVMGEALIGHPDVDIVSFAALPQRADSPAWQPSITGEPGELGLRDYLRATSVPPLGARSPHQDHAPLL